MTDIMVDLETLGTTPGSIILSIGACMFDPVTGDVLAQFYRTIDRASCEAAGLTADASTEAWWAGQSQAARDALLMDTSPLSEVLESFAGWWLAQRGERLWAHAPNFDETLLAAAYRACGVGHPWQFWNVRCTRTIYALAGVKPDRTVGTHHNALDDAIAQAVAVHRAFAALGLAQVAA